jgi:predicted ribosomally synthesized peptide with SipW-like signal peptide
MKRILTSLALILGAALFIVGATRALFSDTETSTGNTFEAGAVDLKVDNTSYWNRGDGGTIVKRDDLSWPSDDLTEQKFFDYQDMKPGDLGEDTISLHTDNDAWVCASVNLTENNDVTCTEPELGDDQTCTVPGEDQGDLAFDLNFVFWRDDGDNVLETGEQVIKEAPATELFDGTQFALADSNTPGGPVPGGENGAYIGKAWCFGELTLAPEDPNDGSPEDRQKTGILCNGEPVSNAAQTDNLVGDITFYAVQSRNNESFECSGEGPSPSPQLSCNTADVMLVLDRSGSIDAGELATLKVAANSFVTTLALSPSGNHAGQSSFSTNGTLDQPLTDSSAAMTAAINALSSGGFTNLKEGIDLANTELAGAGDRNDVTSPDKMVIITDGNPNRPEDGPPGPDVDAANAATAAKAAGVEIFVVGIGADVDATYLTNSIATAVAGHYFSAADYSDLQTALDTLDLCQ